MPRPKSEDEKQLLREVLLEKTGLDPEWTRDEKHNHFGWLRLDDPRQLPAAAAALAAAGARLATISAYAENRRDPARSLMMLYHFSLGGTLLNVQARLYRVLEESPSVAPETGATDEKAASPAPRVEVLAVPSITPWFFNAAWPERECYEMYKVEITGLEIPDKEVEARYGKPKPAKMRRLFLDESIEVGVMTSLLPFSALVNGATTKDLWERVTQRAGGPDND
ncbi:MAG: NADH-quinone oxidoreductase subunit C [Deltaproteobacteria bacterium]|nr:NADH-quinone oxidoreductase subunit C [Deltaproteobacteria bacterium]